MATPLVCTDARDVAAPLGAAPSLCSLPYDAFELALHRGAIARIDCVPRSDMCGKCMHL